MKKCSYQCMIGLKCDTLHMPPRANIHWFSLLVLSDRSKLLPLFEKTLNHTFGYLRKERFQYSTDITIWAELFPHNLKQETLFNIIKWMLKALKQPCQKFWPKILTPYFFYSNLYLTFLRSCCEKIFKIVCIVSEKIG